MWKFLQNIFYKPKIIEVEYENGWVKCYDGILVMKFDKENKVLKIRRIVEEEVRGVKDVKYV